MGGSALGAETQKAAKNGGWQAKRPTLRADVRKAISSVWRTQKITTCRLGSPDALPVGSWNYGGYYIAGDGPLSGEIVEDFVLS